MNRPRVLVSFRSAGRVRPYLEALDAAGIDPLPCTPGSHAPIDRVQGIVLTGGGDIVPSYYGQQPDPQLGEVDPERDAFELGLLTMADGAHLPTLCICRGMQLLNVHRGGTLIQHLPQSDRHRRLDTPKGQAVHGVRVEADSELAALLETSVVQVNSRHHQAVDRVGEGLVVTGRAMEDGVIEALEDPKRRFLLGVEWHPEDQAPEDAIQRRIFTALHRSLKE